MKTFEELKQLLLDRAKEAGACHQGRADSSVREFCLGQTPLNQSVEYRIKTAELMYLSLIHI